MTKINSYQNLGQKFAEMVNKAYNDPTKVQNVKETLGKGYVGLLKEIFGEDTKVEEAPTTTSVTDLDQVLDFLEAFYGMILKERDEDDPQEECEEETQDSIAPSASDENKEMKGVTLKFPKRMSADAIKHLQLEKFEKQKESETYQKSEELFMNYLMDAISDNNFEYLTENPEEVGSGILIEVPYDAIHSFDNNTSRLAWVAVITNVARVLKEDQGWSSIFYQFTKEGINLKFLY